MTCRDFIIHHSRQLGTLIGLLVLGIILWIGMCGHTIFLLVKSARPKSHPDEDPFLKDSLTMLLASYLSILLGSLFNSRIYYEFFWWQTAICMVGVSLAKASAAKTEPAKLPKYSQKKSISGTKMRRGEC